MKGNCKRILAFVMAALLAMTALGGAVMTASASEANGAYVLSYDDGDQPFLYGGRYEYKHSYNDPEAGENSVWTYWDTPEVFNLVYTANGESRSIAAYCTDADTNTVSSTYYRRINLEDSTYYATGAAERLRSVLLNSFPYLTVEQVAETVNGALGEGTVQQLTQGEILSATQQAIWEITHGEKYTVDKNFTTIRSMSGYDTSRFVYPESLEDCAASDYTASNIQNLYNYFLNLEGTAAQKIAVSECSIKNVVYNAEKQEDGTYTVTVSYSISATIGENDSVTLTAACGEQTQNLELAAGEGSVTFTGLSDREEVKLTVSGYQTGGDVYLFDAEGDRTAAQSMVGYDITTLPVYGEVYACPDRVLNIYKTTDVENGKIPLANIEFDIYMVATLAQIESGTVKLSEKPTAEEIAAYQTTENYVTTLKTDAQGFASYNLTANGYPDGVYLVVERENSAVVMPVEPFFAILPGTNSDGTGHEYTVTVYPKNTVETGPEIKKDVTQIENDHDTFDVDQIHTWIIRGGVPAGIANAVKYVISDTMDYRLSLKDNFVVKVGLVTDQAGEEAVTLNPETDYSITTGTATDADNNTVDTFIVALTDAGMDAVAAAVGTGKVADYEVRVYFDAVINSNAQMGTQIPNQATLEYTNSAGIDYDAESDIPEVHTGGINLLKIDSSTENALAGASFKIAREATSEELADESVVKETLTVDGKELTVVFAEFYSDTSLMQKTAEYTTTEDGKVVMYGLAYGTYYIVETKAPADYHLLTAPIVVEIDENSHTEAEQVTVYNSKFVLPETGGMGTTVFTVVGIVLLGSALTLIFISNKKKTV